MGRTSRDPGRLLTPLPPPHLRYFLPTAWSLRSLCSLPHLEVSLPFSVPGKWCGQCLAPEHTAFIRKQIVIEVLLLSGTGGGPEQREKGRRDRACSSQEMARNAFPAGTEFGSPGEPGPECQLAPLGSHHQDGVRSARDVVEETPVKDKGEGKKQDWAGKAFRLLRV